MPRVFLLCVLAGCVAAQTIVIKDVTVIDATGAPERKGLTVAIDGNRISAIEKKIHTRKGMVVIDGKGKFLIPGLWDMHIHLSVPEIISRCWSPTESPACAKCSPACPFR